MSVKTLQLCCSVDDLYSYIEWDVMLMDKKPFDFKDVPYLFVKSSVALNLP